MEIKRKHIIVPYVLGIAWIIIHPIVSIVTGELKCRGIYTDEHQLDPRSYNTQNYPLKRKTVINTNTSTLKKSNESSSSSSSIIGENGGKTNICDVVKDLKKSGRSNDTIDTSNALFLSPYISCICTDSISVLKIVPSQASIDTVESLAIAVPYADGNAWIESKGNSSGGGSGSGNGNGTGSDLHLSILTLMERLQKSPWLAKSILIVSPLSKDISMHTAVEEFIGEFSSTSASTSTMTRKGAKWSNASNSNSSLARRNLPMSFKSNLIRQLIVLDVEELSNFEENQTIHILPQGRSGALPNLDLISAVRYCLLKQVIGRQSKSSKNNTIKMQMHPYDMTWWDNLVVKAHFPKGKWWQHFGEDLGGMFAFMAASLVEMRPSSSSSSSLSQHTNNSDGMMIDKKNLVLPHSPALKEGIDSITIRAVFHPNPDKRVTHRDIVATVQSVEHLIRGLSSLNERLHHSINQYTMPSGSTFVSHGEYILPGILLLLPLALRVILLISHDAYAGASSSTSASTGTTEFQFHHALRCFACALVVSFTFFFLNIDSTLSSSSSAPELHQDESSRKKCAGLIVYAAMFICACGITSGRHREEKYRRNDRRTFQCLACLLALYMQVPLVLSNISLAIPSAIIWVPAFAFFDYGVPTFFSYVMQNGTLILSVFLLQLFSLRMSSLYFCTIATPLHFILAALCWT